MKNPFRKLSQNQIDFIKLIIRSPDLGDRWRSISGVLLESVETQVNLNPELFEFDKLNSRVRFSARGLIIIDYL